MAHRIPFIDARIPLLDEKSIERRIEAREDRGKVRSLISQGPFARARKIHAWLMARSGLAHLKSDQIKMLEPLKNGVRLAGLDDVHAADLVAAELHAEMPWMAPATRAAWRSLRLAALRGEPARVPPLLLVGPPGIGKSAWARQLAERIGVPSVVIEATNEPAGFAVSGLQAGWSSASPGKPLLAILRNRIGNPLVVVDEVEKAGRVTSNSGTPYDLAGAMLPLLERSTAKRWSCPFFRVGFDMSHIGWVLTANSLAGVPEPFMDRCRVIRLGPVQHAELVAFARRQAKRVGLSEEIAGAIVGALNRMGPAGEALSLRVVMRMIEEGEVIEGLPTVH